MIKMNKQKEFDDTFIKQNEKIDKGINKEWENILFSEQFSSLYEEVDNIFDFEMDDKDGNFYQGEDDRYVLEFFDKALFMLSRFISKIEFAHMNYMI